MPSRPWMVSLHGGHSGEFCDHAAGTLRETLEAAVAKGFCIYGLAEHAPRYHPRFLYPDEVAMGWDIPKLLADFNAYAECTKTLVTEFADRLIVLRSFEAEIVPADRYVETMLELRARHAFDYMVGSVHYVDEFLFDYSPDTFVEALHLHGGLEPLAVKYYEGVTKMVEALRPEVVAHFDTIRKYAGPHGPVDTPPIRDAVECALEAVRQSNAILDVNTGPLRKGEAIPNPAPWIVESACDMGIPFCFGDDSHGPDQVGANFALSDSMQLTAAAGYLDFPTKGLESIYDDDFFGNTT